MKRAALSSLGILIAWVAVDAVTHRALLQGIYAASPGTLRPVGEMNTALVAIATLALTFVFVAAYAVLVRPKSLKAGLVFGTLVGFALGTASGLGTYVHTPISPMLAAAWFLLGIIKGAIAGAMLGAVYGKHPHPNELPAR